MAVGAQPLAQLGEDVLLEVVTLGVHVIEGARNEDRAGAPRGSL
jgi:hypothetical protein